MQEWRAVILAAGAGSRMKSALAKPLHRIAGASMLDHVLWTVAEVAPSETILVASPENRDALAQAAPKGFRSLSRKRRSARPMRSA